MASAAERTRVVHVTEAYGGVETYLQLMLDHWADDHVEFAFVLGEDGDLADRLRASGHEVVVVEMPRTTTRVRELRAVLRLRRALRRLSPDVVHLHSSQAGFIGRLAWARRGTTVYTPHAFYYLGKTGLARRVFRGVEQVLARAFPCRVVATSPSEAHRAVHDVGHPASRVVTVTNGVEGAGATPRLPQRRVRVGAATRVCPQKDVDTYLRMVRRLRDRLGDDVTCDLVGVGHYADDDQTLAAALAGASVTPDDVTITPWIPRAELREWLRTCDVVVLPSRYESFGYLLAEANAVGVPVLGTDVDGIRDVVVPGVNGYLVAPHDDAALAEHVVRMCSDAEEYAALSAGALEAVQERLSVHRFVAELAAVYVSTDRDVRLVPLTTMSDSTPSAADRDRLESAS